VTETDRKSCEQRVLILAPTSKDAELSSAVLRDAGVLAHCYRDLDEIYAQLPAGAGAILLPEEAVDQDRQHLLADWLERQPPWSDLPVLILALPGADSAAVTEAMDLLGNVTVLERPIRVAALVSAVRTALRARQRQYQIRDHLAEHELNERALRAAREQLQIVTDNMAVAVARCSRDLRYLWVSAGLAAWQRMREEDIVGKPIVEIIGEPAFETLRPSIEQVLTGERVELEIRIPYKALGPRWIHAVYVPTLERSGRPDGWVAVITDVTARHEMEAALREADRRKDELLAVLAHELRNPLAPIRTSLEVLRLTACRDPASERVAEMMQRQINHMVRLVDDLLEVSRITRGKIELRRETLDLAAVVRGAVDTSRPAIDAAGHQLEVSLPAEPLLVDGDPVRLTQVIANLLNNAAKYTAEGGKIWVTLRRKGESVEISVRDTGQGIPAEMLPRVFNLFIQGKRSDGRAEGGLGIGLTLVKSLAEMHGGSVQASSEGPGRGSELVVRLPLIAELHPPEPEEPQRRAAGELARRRVLVVDDNRDAAESLGLLLELLGTEVQIAYDGPEALQRMDTYRPDVVLLDLGMPGMDGLEVARRIRQRPELHSPTLIALTGWGQEADRRRSREAGFDHHLIKPADIAVLKDLLLSLEERESGAGR
jgi:PAS domain S-box-containing protein